MKSLLKKVNKFIAPSNFLREKFIKFGIPSSKIILSNDGMETKAFINFKKSVSQNLRLGFIGTILPHKGLHILIDAFNEIQDDKAILKIYGSSKVSPAYYRKMKMLSVNPNIKFMGEFDCREIASVLSEIDVLVFPSVWYENCPLTIQEAFIARTPVIASNIGAIPEFVHHGENGLLFEVGNPGDLYKKIKMVIDNPNLINELSKNIKPVKTIEKDTDVIEQFYSKLTPSRENEPTKLGKNQKCKLVGNQMTMLDLPSHTINKNKRLWDNYDWSQAGEEWTSDGKRYKGLDPNSWKASLINEMMLKYVKKDSMILEIGPGAGRWTEILQRLDSRLVLVDISEKCLNLCKERFKTCNNIEYHLVRKRLDFIDSNSIDYIWAYDVFVHINPTDVERYIEDFQRILKPGGCAIIHHSGAYSEKDRVEGFRSYMGGKLFAHLVAKYGMKMIEQNDALVHKPGDLISVFIKPFWFISVFMKPFWFISNLVGRIWEQISLNSCSLHNRI